MSGVLEYMKMPRPMMQKIRPVILRIVLMRNIRRMPEMRRRTDSRGISLRAMKEYSKLEM